MVEFHHPRVGLPMVVSGNEGLRAGGGTGGAPLVDGAVGISHGVLVRHPPPEVGAASAPCRRQCMVRCMVGYAQGFAPPAHFGRVPAAEARFGPHSHPCYIRCLCHRGLSSCHRGLSSYAPMLYKWCSAQTSKPSLQGDIGHRTRHSEMLRSRSNGRGRNSSSHASHQKRSKQWRATGGMHRCLRTNHAWPTQLKCRSIAGFDQGNTFEVVTEPGGFWVRNQLGENTGSVHRSAYSMHWSGTWFEE